MFYYLDTSIWLDFYEKRGKNGESAQKLLHAILENGEFILYSDWHLNELKKLGYVIEDFNKMLSVAKPAKIQRVHIYREQREEARKLALQRKIPPGDALHAILARDNEAILVSRDEDFARLKDVCETNMPEILLKTHFQSF